VLRRGKNHPHYYRELLLELWRQAYTDVSVSRLECSFVFTEKAFALSWAEEREYVHRVEPVDDRAATVLVDAMWIEWMGEGVADVSITFARIAAYWDGRPSQEAKPEAQAMWERLFACPLRVVGYP